MIHDYEMSAQSKIKLVFSSDDDTKRESGKDTAKIGTISAINTGYNRSYQI